MPSRRSSGSDCHVEGYGEVAFVGHEPSGDILGDDFDIGNIEVCGCAVEVEGQLPSRSRVAMALASRFLMISAAAFICFPNFGPSFEVGFDTLHENAFVVAYDFKVLNIDFALDEFHDGFECFGDGFHRPQEP